MNGFRNSGIPLGGLGAGTVELRADGYLHEWQIMNNLPWGSGPMANVPGDACFFGMQVSGRRNESVLLGLAAPWSGAPEMRGFVNNMYGMPWLVHAEEIAAECRFPFTTLTYTLPGVPVDVSLEAFTPFIPLDAGDSALPLGFFTFTLRNRTRQRVRLSLFGALRNLVGYTKPENLSRMTYRKRGGMAAICFEREKLSVNACDNGSMVLAGWSARRTRDSYVLHVRNTRDIWESLRRNGVLEDVDHGDFSGSVGDMGADAAARTRGGLPLGVLCHALTLPAGSVAEVVFCLGWHFPAFRERDYPAKRKSGQVVGHQYNTRFKSAVDVVRYGRHHAKRLRDRTRRFTDAYYNSTLPSWLLDAVSAQLTTLTKCSWWDEQGRFGIWEGLGCCGLQTTDITHYGSFPIALFFPELQKSQMRLSRNTIEVKGKIPHLMPGNFQCCDVDHRNRIDLIPQFILLVWRDVLWTGDLDYAREMWPTIDEALKFFQTFDTDGDGLPNNTGPDQTYDQFPLKGTSAFVGLLYAASLRAAADLARLLGNDAFAEDREAELEGALKKLHEQLWTGKSYRLCYDPKTRCRDEGVMADQVNGDWFVRQTTGEGLLPDSRIRSALREVVRQCSRPEGYLANCSWVRGKGVDIRRTTSDQANWPWSGVEYAVAAHLALMGMERQALRVAHGVWERYERAGGRFNHIECGGHYYRALSSWALYLALFGFALDTRTGRLSLRVWPAPARFVLNTPTGWGTVETRSKYVLVLSVEDGTLSFRSLRLTGAKVARAAASLDGKRQEVTCRSTGEGIDVQFSQTLRLKAGRVLQLRFR